MVKESTNIKEVKQALIKELNLFTDATLISSEEIKATERHTFTLLELKRLELTQHTDYYYKKYSESGNGHTDEYYREKYVECMNELADVLDLIHTLQDKNTIH